MMRFKLFLPNAPSLAVFRTVWSTPSTTLEHPAKTWQPLNHVSAT